MAAIILIMVVAFPFVTVSQTKHVSKWFVGNYLLDFTTNPITISQLESPFYNKNEYRRKHYVDADGRIRLVQVGTMLYDGEGNEIKHNGQSLTVHFSYLIPMPNNDHIICGIGGGSLYKIDIEKNVIISVEHDVAFPEGFFAIHNADCSGVWLIQPYGNSINRQLLTSEGIIDAQSVPVSNIGYDQNTIYNFSWDCKYCTWSGSDGIRAIVYIDRFDRRTATFQQIATYNFGEGSVYSGIFAPDNSKVYYSLRHYGEKIVEVPIGDDVPDFDNMRTICQFNYKPSHLIAHFYFGLDGRLYIFDKGEIHVVEFFDDGQFKFTKNFLTLEGSSFLHGFGTYLPDWYSDDPCSGTPCPDMPAPVIIKE